MPRKGGARKRASLSWDSNDYTPDVLASKDLGDIRKEYSRLRGIAEKRLETLGKHPVYSEYDVYTRNKDKFRPLAQIGSKAELVHSLSEISRFVGAKTSSVRGLTQERNSWVASMRERGYTWVNKDNAQQVREFMEGWRAKGNAKIYDSERVLNALRVAQNKNADPQEVLKHFKFWLENYKAIEDLELPEGETVSSAEVSRALNNKKRRDKRAAAKGKRK